MPYVKPEIREALKTRRPKTAGELNYVITTALLEDPNVNVYPLLIRYVADNGASYQVFNDVLGVLAAVPLELNRRGFGPSPSPFRRHARTFYYDFVTRYEEKKIKENGDLPGFTAKG